MLIFPPILTNLPCETGVSLCSRGPSASPVHRWYLTPGDSVMPSFAPLRIHQHSQQKQLEGGRVYWAGTSRSQPTAEGSQTRMKRKSLRDTAALLAPKSIFSCLFYTAQALLIED